MKFKPNHFYQHKMGRTIAILGELKTHAWGKQFIIEETDPTGQGISCVSPDENHSDWKEVSLDEWKVAMAKDRKCILCTLKIALDKEYRHLPNRGLVHEDCFQAALKEYKEDQEKQNA